MATYKFVNADQLDSDLSSLGDAIRSKGGTTEQLVFPTGMVSAIRAISTGVEFNFDVKAYATEAELLADTPKENTIGIITTTPIDRWAFVGTSVVDDAWGSEGDLYIYSGTDNSATSAFNALKKNEIILSPMSAKQKVGGTYVGVPAMIYKGGAWAELKALTIIDGTEQSAEYSAVLLGGYGSVGASPNSDSIRFIPANHSTLYWTPPILLDDYKTLKVTIKRANSSNAYVGIFNGTKPDNWEEPKTVAKVDILSQDTEKEYTLDLTYITGENGILVYGYSQDRYIDISELVLL